MTKTLKDAAIILTFILSALVSAAQSGKSINVIGYYFGPPEKVDSIAAEKLTHVIFSFCHLKGNLLQVDDPQDAATIASLVGLKKRNPSLKVLLSLGGWGGCATCSEVFSSAEGRKEFANSVLALNKFLGTDGIDLDWEYPAIEGYPGHLFQPADKKNFTALVQELRSTLGDAYEISFAAGGFQKFLVASVEWKEVMAVVDRVNLMTYDLVNGYSTVTGHHTALYSAPGQAESTDNAVRYLLGLGIPANKLVIGAAFYGRMWEDVPATNNGLYQPGKFKRGVNFRRFDRTITKEKGFTTFWDDKVKAPYAYNAAEKLFITFDNQKSMAIKTAYAIDHKLNGIMFWELTNDAVDDGLLNAIDKAVKQHKTR